MPSRYLAGAPTYSQGGVPEVNSIGWGRLGGEGARVLRADRVPWSS